MNKGMALKYFNRLAFIISIITTFTLFNSGCSSRNGSPVMLGDSTLIYLPKSENGLNAKITLGKKLSRKTGNPVDAGTIFTLQDQAKLYAAVELENRASFNKKELMLHVDWISPTGYSFYKKRTDLQPEDSTNTITSSISVSPEKRRTGEYKVRVYLFRELIAEKKFYLFEAVKDTSLITTENITGKVKATITFCKKFDEKTGKPVGSGKVFTIGSNAKVTAIINFEIKDTSGQKAIKFYADWIGPDDSSFFRKKLSITSPDSTVISSVSIAPEKRKPGKYFLRIYHSGNLVAEEYFELAKQIKKQAVPEAKAEVVSSEIILCSKLSKKTGKPVSAGTVFTIKDNAKVKAVVNIEMKKIKANEQMIFYFDWIGPDGKSFYKKRMVYTTSTPLFTLTNSISASPDKREPGTYTLRFSFGKKIIAEKKFELIAQTK
jgi:hypothetical protein